MRSVYPRASLVDHMRRCAWRHLDAARTWRLDEPYFSRTFRDREARRNLTLAGAYRRRLIVFMNEPGRYVTPERHDQIMRGRW